METLPIKQQEWMWTFNPLCIKYRVTLLHEMITTWSNLYTTQASLGSIPPEFLVSKMLNPELSGSPQLRSSMHFQTNITSPYLSPISFQLIPASSFWMLRSLQKQQGGTDTTEKKGFSSQVLAQLDQSLGLAVPLSWHAEQHRVGPPHWNGGLNPTWPRDLPLALQAV